MAGKHQQPWEQSELRGFMIKVNINIFDLLGFFVVNYDNFLVGTYKMGVTLKSLVSYITIKVCQINYHYSQEMGPR
jgi:hypothetical protein